MCTLLKINMDYEPKDRRKKKDKAREKFERNGGYSAAHARAYEQRIKENSKRKKN